MGRRAASYNINIWLLIRNQDKHHSTTFWQGGDWLKAGAVVLSAGLYIADEDPAYSQKAATMVPID